MASNYDRLSDSSTHSSSEAGAVGRDRRRPEETNEEKLLNPQSATSWSFTWLGPLLSLARERPLEQTDSPPLPAKCTTRFNTMALARHWSQSQSGSSTTTNTFRLARAIWQVYGTEYAGIGIYLFLSTLVSFAGPVLLHALVLCAEDVNTPPLLIAVLISGLFLSKVIVSLMATRYSFKTSMLSVSIGSGIKGCIFDKTLRLSTLARQQYTAGNITNLYTVDIERVVGLAVVLHNFWALPLQILVAMGLLWQVVSYAMFAGLAAILLILMVNNYISLLQKRANDLIMTAKDERMKVTAECFGAMLIIKLNAWEPKFQAKILACREEELKHIWTMLFVSAFNICLLWMAPCVVAVSTIVSFSNLLKGAVTAAKVFTALSLFRMLQDPLRNLPGNITQLFQAMSSLQRLQRFWDMYDKGEGAAEAGLVGGAGSPLWASTTEENKEKEEEQERGLVVIPASAWSWSSSQPYSHSPTESSLSSSSSSASFSSSSSLLASLRRRLASLYLLASSSSSPASPGVSGGAAVEMMVSGRNRTSKTMNKKKKAKKVGAGALDDSLDANSSHPLRSSDHGMDEEEEEEEEEEAEREEEDKDEEQERWQGGSSLDDALSVDTVVFSPVSAASLHPNGNTSASASAGRARGESNSSIDAGGKAFALRLPRLTLRPGQLVVLRGIVGGGKSSVISAILGEMYDASSFSSTSSSHREEQGVRVQGSVAYASQQAWIRNASIKQNILFGLDFDENAYRRTIDACCLQQDFSELPFGDETHIGERGVNLSGGQKARIALARAVYADTDVVLLDDILAALDAIVARKVFERCILGLLAGKTRLLVTHSEDVMASPAVDVHLEAVDGCITIVSSRNPDSVAVTTRCSSSIREIAYSLSSDAASGPSKVGSVTESEEKDKEEDEDDEDEDKQAALARVVSLSSVRRNYSFSGRSVEEDEEEVRDAVKVAPPVNDDLKEERAMGKVDSRVYWSYLQAMGGWRVVCFLLCVQTTWQMLSVGSDLYLSHWTREPDEEQSHSAGRNALIYAALSLGSGSIVLVRTLTVSSAGYTAAKGMFEKMLNSLLHAPMNWLDKNPSGRLLNRLSDDQAKVDCNLPFAVGSVFATFFSVGGDLLTVCVITRYLAVLSVPIFWGYRRIMTTYLTASREIQRLQSVSQSPVLTSMSELVVGVSIVRAFGPSCAARLIVQNEGLIDANGTMAFLASATSSWFVLRIQLVGAFILLVISVLVFLGRDYLSPGLVGLSISYGLSISNGLQGAVMILSWFENSMVCPERIQQYCDVGSEGSDLQRDLFRRADIANEDVDADEDGDGVEEKKLRSQRKDHTARHAEVACGEEKQQQQQRDEEAGKEAAEWPSNGHIDFQNVCFSYQPSSDLVLNRLSFSILGGEKVGIVGRTGSGKSSLAMSLFRIADLAAGRIFIDGIDISTLSLQQLRGGLAIIPQNPVLFKGSLRSYIDPFDEFTDEQVWAAVVKAQMADSVKRLYATSASASVQDKDSVFKYLSAQVSDSGDNLSVGERQMLVMARALLRGAKILVMDEASANIDRATEIKLQTILRKTFSNTTTLTIAHRVETILHCDRILVMANGSVQELDSPRVLLAREGSLFRALALDAGVAVPPLQT